MIYKKISQIANALKVAKGNKVAFKSVKYEYRNINDIRMALKPLLFDNAVCYIPTQTINNNVVTIESTFVDLEDNDNFNTSFSVIIDNHDGMSREQAIGSASSYAEKYLLSALFMLEDNTPDVDSQEVRERDATAIEKAIAELQNCKTLEELSACCKKYPQYINTPRFLAVGKTKKSELCNNKNKS